MRVPTIILSLLVLSCTGGTSQKPTGPKMLRYLALGDSYTIGESVRPEERWCAQLVKLLRARGVRMGDPEIIAKTGWTTAELNAGIDEAKPEAPFDLVSLLIGVNNQYRGYSLDEYRVEFRGLLDRAIAFAGGHQDRVVVLSIPDWGATPFAEGRDRMRIAHEIDIFNDINRLESQKRDVRYVDVTPVSRTVAADPAMVAADGLHPSGKMYAEWARLTALSPIH